jgi:hypothetical protein
VWSWTAVVLLAAACASGPPQPGKIRVGMTKAELVATLGDPVEQRAPTADQHGRTEELWYFVLKPEVASGREVTRGVLTSGVGFFDDPTKGHRYEFVFVDDHLARWGPDRSK